MEDADEPSQDRSYRPKYPPTSTDALIGKHRLQRPSLTISMSEKLPRTSQPADQAERLDIDLGPRLYGLRQIGAISLRTQRAPALRAARALTSRPGPRLVHAVVPYHHERQARKQR
jgi:hypothetical protein